MAKTAAEVEARVVIKDGEVDYVLELLRLQPTQGGTARDVMNRGLINKIEAVIQVYAEWEEEHKQDEMDEARSVAASELNG